MYQNNKTGGFTLVELMLSMAFIGSLLIVISLIIMQIMGLYNKGLTLKEVNEVSRVVVRDIQQSVSGSDAFTLQYEDTSTNPSTVKVPVSLQLATEHEVDYYSNDAGGRLCTGVYSYAWNTGAAVQAATPTIGVIGGAATTYKNPGNNDAPSGGYPIQFTSRLLADGSRQLDPIRFIKNRDPAKTLCKLPAGDTPTTTQFDKKLGNQEDYLNVFGAGNNNLMLYKFAISTPLGAVARDNQSQVTAVSTFYSVNMVVGTQMGDESNGLITANEVCKPPSQATQNEGEYCAVNKIDFVARTGRIAR